jgi:hypothetical protein
MSVEDEIPLADGDFRRERRYLAPHVFAWPGGDEPDAYPPPEDLLSEEHWRNIMSLPTDVGLKSSSYEGSLVGRIDQLQRDWVFSWPDVEDAPFIAESALLAGEEFDALVFNAMHGWYRQAIGCLRNALETMAVASALAVSNNKQSFDAWRAGTKAFGFGVARAMIRDTATGKRVDADAAPGSVFGDADTSWMKNRYARLCAYAHSQAGYNNADFWESNGPIFVPAALAVVEAELRETLALCYLLMRLGWPGYQRGRGQQPLLDGPQGEWARYDGVLRRWLLP